VGISAVIIDSLEQRARAAAIKVKRDMRKVAKAKARERRENGAAVTLQATQEDSKTVKPVAKKRKRDPDEGIPGASHDSDPRKRKTAKVIPEESLGKEKHAAKSIRYKHVAK
jgi:hypothetical protein